MLDNWFLTGYEGNDMQYKWDLQLIITKKLELEKCINNLNTLSTEKSTYWSDQNKIPGILNFCVTKVIFQVTV